MLNIAVVQQDTCAGNEDLKRTGWQSNFLVEETEISILLIQKRSWRWLRRKRVKYRW